MVAAGRLATTTLLVVTASLASCSGIGSGERNDPIAPEGERDAEPPRSLDAGDAGTGEKAPSIALGAKDRILLSGTVVTPFAIVEGQVLVEGNLVTCVEPGKACAARPGAQGATFIETAGVIAPGLIDTHNHILFDIFDDDDWKPLALYDNHDQWTQEARYQAMLDVKQCLANDSQGKPVWCAETSYGTPAGSLRCEMDKWGELKGLIAGTTSIVGLPGTSAGCFGSLARSIDVAQNGLGSDSVQTSAIFPPSNPDGTCQNFTTGATDAFLVHVGEGKDARSRGEFTTLGSITDPQGCLYASQTAITHGTAFTATEFTAMAAASMKLVWSPRSNVSLYGQTTNLPAALEAGVLVALAPDWSMGGSQNLLDELRFADEWDDKHWQNLLTPKDLVHMVTNNAARVVGLDGTLGQIRAGGIADIAVFAGDRAKPYEAIVAATPRDVRLVLVGGTVLYGDALFAPAGPAAPGCEAIDVCGQSKFVCVATTNATNKLDQTLATIKAQLEQALVDADARTPADGWSFAPLTPLVKCP